MKKRTSTTVSARECDTVQFEAQIFQGVIGHRMDEEFINDGLKDFLGFLQLTGTVN
jgi:hypothetical protein